MNIQTTHSNRPSCSHSLICAARWALPTISLIGYAASVGTALFVGPTFVANLAGHEKAPAPVHVLGWAGTCMLLPIASTALATAAKTAQAAHTLCTTGYLTAKNVLSEAVKPGGLIFDTFIPNLKQIFSASQQGLGYREVGQ